ncbi:MAG: (E)-4-hydroxy-3-methylbut-2-enyl-diphosphate synthase [Verrucomicrobia bacterium]|nr:(E)-4-hydroxy-3-methylbut-2-enyl-diphosphate synthase [Verrucomicrobiota bacterium]MBS0646766.1 (E)-4-hydroxy-3-methylbut-2-enyl-diphosphate synthase [Verrucomicrobiota bacterium]
MKNNYQTSRRLTHEVLVGNVGIGGMNPVRVQSMTTSDTRDVMATVEQILQLEQAGCELVRVTVQGMKEAEACEQIKTLLIQKGCFVPLIADIHFYPPAAMRVVDSVDKVRINPGNFVDKRASFQVIEYDDESYAAEIKKIEEKFSPLVEKCKRLKKAMRIGVNHGSLSDRIMNRFGDTPAGMVESAFEFTRICRQMDYQDVIFSMKASNASIMIEAYRLLVLRMQQEGWTYPLHLGVTEAGEGEDGRIKSAIGIGSLLLDGIGDTIRVSLTEDPWYEIDPCRRLVEFTRKHAHYSSQYQPIVRRIGELPSYLHRDGSVFLEVSQQDLESSSFYQDLGCDMQLGQPSRGNQTVEGVVTHLEHSKLDVLKKIGLAVIEPQENKDVIFFSPQTLQSVLETREFVKQLSQSDITKPLILSFKYQQSLEDVTIQAAAELGSLLCDRLAQGICLSAPQLVLSQRRSIAFSILQGCRMRASKTEFISCPGCGRTLFNLQKVAASIREKTAHLPGVKIAIMGCIVNGPGEMADADFGYVGSKPGMIDLYVGKTCVERNIPMDQAQEHLIALIQAHGRWVEPKV